MDREQQVAIFADLDNPKVANFTAESILNGLEQIAAEGFDYFSPRNLSLCFMGNMAQRDPDSEYGNRMDLTTKIIASTLYSGQGLAQYFREVSSENQQQADQEETRYQSIRYRLAKNIKLIPERCRRIFGLGRIRFDSYLNDELEQAVI